MRTNQASNLQISDVNDKVSPYVSEWDIENHFVHKNHSEDINSCADTRIVLLKNGDSAKTNFKDIKNSKSDSDNNVGLIDYINEADVNINPPMDSRSVIIVNKDLVEDVENEKYPKECNVKNTLEEVDDVYKIAAKNRVCPIDVNRCKKLFEGYEESKLESVLSSIENGVNLHSDIVDTGRENDFYNHKSALENEELVTQKINKEVALGRIIGPFDKKPPGLIVSPLAAVPKDNNTTIRLIHDLSYPKKNSVNSHIPRHLCIVEYETLDDCLSIIASLGYGTMMGKTDIKNAYRIFECRVQDYRLLGFTWLNKWWFDRCLPMGGSISCSKFEDFSKLLHWVMTNKFAIPYMSHIIDDFMVFGPRCTTICQKSLDLFIQVCAYLNIPIKHEKTYNATTELELHGIKVCTLSMTASLPEKKLNKAIRLIDAMLSVKKTTVAKMQELCGFLNFCLRIIPSGRPFMRRLYDLTKGKTAKWYSINLNKDVKDDLLVWKHFLASYNGKVIISSDVWCDDFKYEIFSDASGFAFAGFCNDRWFQGEFPESWKNVNIAIKEAVPVYLAFRLWFTDVKDCRILFNVDNESVVHMLNSQTSHVNCILLILRKMVLKGMQNNLQFQARHLSGKSNFTADLLSRLQTQKALAHAKWLNPAPDVIPPEWEIWKELQPVLSEDL